jgi:hypothetical protein
MPLKRKPLNTILKTHELLFLRSLCDITKRTIEQGFELYDRFSPLECGIEAHCQYNKENKKELKLRYSLDKHSQQLFTDALTIAKTFFGKEDNHKLFLDNPLQGKYYVYKFVEV